MASRPELCHISHYVTRPGLLRKDEMRNLTLILMMDFNVDNGEAAAKCVRYAWVTLGTIPHSLRDTASQGTVTADEL